MEFFGGLETDLGLICPRHLGMEDCSLQSLQNISSPLKREREVSIEIGVGINVGIYIYITTQAPNLSTERSRCAYLPPLTCLCQK